MNCAAIGAISLSGHSFGFNELSSFVVDHLASTHRPEYSKNADQRFARTEHIALLFIPTTRLVRATDSFQRPFVIVVRTRQLEPYWCADVFPKG
jgi:hypothetical protein